MKPTLKTSMVRLDACETVMLGGTHWPSRQVVTRQRHATFDISDEQAAKITELLEKARRLAEQIAEIWAQITALSEERTDSWGEIVTCHAAMIGQRDDDSIGSVKCVETRGLSQIKCDETQVTEKQTSKRK